VSDRDEVIGLLRSIDASLKQLVQQQRAPEIASDRDLDGKYGDPEVKFMPRDWAGPSYKGRRFSECPADLLDMIAETFDYFARKAEATNETTDRGKPVSQYKRADAARARGWAKRIRAGVVRQHVQNNNGSGDGWATDDGF
jgi:hypothetical protein